MPQPHKVSIGFDEGGIERLQHLVRVLGSTQREVIAALIALPEELIQEAILKYRVKRDEAKDEKRAKRILDKMTPDAIRRLLDDLQKDQAAASAAPAPQSASPEGTPS